MNGICAHDELMRRCSLLASLLVVFQVQAASLPGFTLSSNLTVTRVAGPAEVRFPMFACFDEAGRLFVAESSGEDLYLELQKLTRKCKIKLLEDSDGDGVFERAGTFAEQLVFPMGLAWRDGKLFVADPPDLVTWEDLDGDGRADKRQVILTGFGHTDNGSLHGLTFGPDGWLYMTMGQPDGYRLKTGENTYVSGKSGALIRCLPDGSRVEVVCRGFENLVEIAFMPAGEIVGTDNWFALPTDGIRDALVHLVDGGLYPLKIRDEGTPMIVSGAPLPAISLYPAVALSGLTRLRGNALGADFADTLVSAQFNTRKVAQHRLQRFGSTFRSIEQDLVVSSDPDFHPSDVCEDADGSLLVVDTGSWYVQHCPTGRIRKSEATGGIFRIRNRNVSPIRDPRGLQLDWTAPTMDQLVKRFTDDRVAVRERAAVMLRQPESEAVDRLIPLRHHSSMQVREQAIWLLAASSDPAAHAAVQDLLRDPLADIRALTARSLARFGAKSAGSPLSDLLKDAEPAVRLAAAEALAHCGAEAQLEAVFDALANQPDRFLEHALVHALFRLAGKDVLVKALSHRSPAVRRIAIVLLDQPPRQALPIEPVLDGLGDSDEQVRSACRAALLKHPDWILRTLPVVQKLALQTVRDSDIVTVREFIEVFHKNADVAALTVKILRESKSDALKVETLSAMASVPPAQFPNVWTSELGLLLKESDPPIRSAAVRVARSIRNAALDASLLAIADDSSHSIQLREEAIRALKSRTGLGSTTFAFLASRLSGTNLPAVRLRTSELLAAARLSTPQLKSFLELTRDDLLISPDQIFNVARHAAAPEKFIPELLEVAEKRAAAHIQTGPEQLRWLERMAPESERSRVRNLAAAPPSQAEAVAQLQSYEPLLSLGDPNRGHALFLGKAACYACHQVGKQGGLVGPDLTHIGAIRSGRDLIEALVLPNASFAQGYEPYTIQLHDGQAINGLRVRTEDDSFVLRDASGGVTRLAPAQIKTIQRGEISVMPEGLLQSLSRPEIADLFAYLQSLK